MARSHARILVSAWQDEDFTTLTADQQWAFFLLISQPDLTYAGTIAYMPNRWARLAADTTPFDIEKALAALEDRRMVVVDRDTDELWVCSFVKHDGLLSQPNMVKAMRSAALNVLSKPIRDGLYERYLKDLPPDPPKGYRKGYRKGSSNPNGRVPETPSEGFAEGLPEGQGVGVGVGVGVGEDLQQLTQLSEGTHLRAVPDEPAPQRVKNGVGQYASAYRTAHKRAPMGDDKATLARVLRRHIDDINDVELLAVCFALGNEGKDPKNFKHVLNDYRREVAS